MVELDDFRPDTAFLELGLDRGRLTSAVVVSDRGGRRTHRVRCGAESYILKSAADWDAALEGRRYRLLEELGVPTLRVHGTTETAVLLEDLSVSERFRPAEPADCERAETGTALARWYRALHDAGRTYLQEAEVVPSCLRREYDLLDAETVLATGDTLGLAANPVWAQAAERLETLKSALRETGETLNYNDFHWSNVAVCRTHPVTEAVVYDYHLLGIGPACADCRNVAGGLSGPAREAFAADYGPVDERASLLDAPLAVLYALKVAADRGQRPGWAAPLVARAESGELAADLDRACAVIE